MKSFKHFGMFLLFIIYYSSFLRVLTNTCNSLGAFIWFGCCCLFPSKVYVFQILFLYAVESTTHLQGQSDQHVLSSLATVCSISNLSLSIPFPSLCSSVAAFMCVYVSLLLCFFDIPSSPWLLIIWMIKKKPIYYSEQIFPQFALSRVCPLPNPSCAPEVVRSHFIARDLLDRARCKMEKKTLP